MTAPLFARQRIYAVIDAAQVIVLVAYRGEGRAEVPSRWNPTQAMGPSEAEGLLYRAFAAAGSTYASAHPDMPSIVSRIVARKLMGDLAYHVAAGTVIECSDQVPELCPPERTLEQAEALIDGAIRAMYCALTGEAVPDGVDPVDFINRDQIGPGGAA